MQEKTKHPFQPGTEVAVVSGYDDGRFTKCATQTKTRLEQRAKRAVHFVRDVFRPAEMTEWQIEALEYAIKLYKGCPTKPEGAT